MGLTFAKSTKKERYLGIKITDIKISDIKISVLYFVFLAKVKPMSFIFSALIVWVYL